MAVYHFQDGSSIRFSDIPSNCCPHTPSRENRHRKFSTRDELLYTLMTHCELKEEQAKAHVDFMFDKWNKTKAEAKKKQEQQEHARAEAENHELISKSVQKVGVWFPNVSSPSRDRESSLFPYADNPLAASLSSNTSASSFNLAEASKTYSSRPAKTLDQLEKTLSSGRITTEPLPPASLTTRAKESARNLARKISRRRRKQDRREDEEPLL